MKHNQRPRGQNIRNILNLVCSCLLHLVPLQRAQKIVEDGAFSCIFTTSTDAGIESLHVTTHYALLCLQSVVLPWELLGLSTFVVRSLSWKLGQGGWRWEFASAVLSQVFQESPALRRQAWYRNVQSLQNEYQNDTERDTSFIFPDATLHFSKVIGITTLNNQECMRWCERRVDRFSVFHLGSVERECAKDCRSRHCTSLLSRDLKPSFRCMQTLWPGFEMLWERMMRMVTSATSATSTTADSRNAVTKHSLHPMFLQASPGKLPGPRCFQCCSIEQWNNALPEFQRTRKSTFPVFSLWKFRA